MNLDTIPLFSMLKSRLGYENQRQKLISQNVANTDTPGYAPKDLKTFTVTTAESGSGGKLAMVQPASTNAFHLIAPDGAGGQTQWKAISTSDSETTLDGNKVVLEDQMAKMAESRMSYEAAIGFYEKSLAMIQLAARIPGK